MILVYTYRRETSKQINEILEIGGTNIPPPSSKTKRKLPLFENLALPSYFKANQNTKSWIRHCFFFYNTEMAKLHEVHLMVKRRSRPWTYVINPK